MRFTVEFINHEDLEYFVGITFRGDSDIIQLFDKNINVKSQADCVESVVSKIKNNYPGAKIRGVYIDNKPVGYYVHDGAGSLISFGIDPRFRQKDTTSKFFECIKAEIGSDFTCMLYSHNTRAIKWLEKQGMVKVFDNITILQSCQ